jgi:hypothetical protein
MAAATDSSRTTYIDVLSAATGLDPRVLDVWISGEGHPGDEPGYFNYMNITTGTAQSLGVPTTGSGPPSSNPTAIFGNLAAGVAAALAEIRSLGLGAEQGKSPQQQISDIAASPWASSHYGGPGGPNLVSVFEQRYGAGALSQGSVSAQPSFSQVAAAGGKGSPYGGVPFGGQVQSAVSAVTGPISTAEDAIKFVFSYRFLEIVAGLGLVAIGLVGLAREVGVKPPPLPGPLGQADAAVNGPISAQPRRVQRRAGFEPQSAERDRREARRRLSTVAPGDTIPF